MADTPDDLLERARRAWQDWKDAQHRTDAEMAAIRLAMAWENLDTLLTAGGPLPVAWATAAKPEEQP